MSSLNMADRHNLEKFPGMSGGYVLNFSDRTFGEFIFEAVGVDVHSERYTTDGTSKARKLRTFWKLESDYLVGKPPLRQARRRRGGHADNFSVRDAQGDEIVSKCRQTTLCDTVLPDEVRAKDAYA